MNILIYDLNGSFLTYDIEFYLRKLGHNCKNILRLVYNKYDDEAFMSEMERELSNNSYDMVFTTNYYPIVSRVCNQKAVPYYSWTYDSPPEIHSIETMDYPTNHIFFFTKYDQEYFASFGLDNVHYLPLAVNTDRLAHIERKKEYTSDVSLVGGLYHSKFMRYRSIMSPEQQQYVDAVLVVQQKHCGSKVIDTALTVDFVNNVCNHYRSLSTDAIQPDKAALFYSMCAHLTHIDRMTLLSLCGKRGIDTRLYYGKIKNEDEAILEKNNVVVMDSVAYMDQMPAVFKSTKINLNSTLRANRTGIPLRVVDVLGAGGFLLTNLQSEMLNFFKEDELATFETTEEAIEKIEFYLKNEDLRNQFAIKGHERILKDFTYEDRLTSMLES